MNYVKEVISELDSERIRSDINAAKRLYELASMSIEHMTSHKWAIDRYSNFYLYSASVPCLESAISQVYAYFFKGRLYEMLVTGMFDRFSVEVTMNDASLDWRDANMHSAFKLALLELGLPFQCAADVFTEELGITFDSDTAVFEFSPKNSAT